eukprot:TRINITY_DN65485_c0_g1_i1.p1 TRINITY_DN65485_c0_g1~~TRINITY_DN65485_c0_g1_i1.p1  ORF type:complete len:565 (+),score=141.82 TRINITY_DN65485_c0_g1_i1:189-1883(+)
MAEVRNTRVRCAQDAWTCRFPRPRSADASGQLSMDYLLLELRECLLTLGEVNNPIEVVRNIRKWADLRLQSHAARLQFLDSSGSANSNSHEETTLGHDNHSVPSLASAEQRSDSQPDCSLPPVHNTAAGRIVRSDQGLSTYIPPDFCNYGHFLHGMREAIRVALAESLELLQSSRTAGQGADLLEQTAQQIDFHKRLEHEVVTPNVLSAATEEGRNTAWANCPSARVADDARHLCKSAVVSARQGRGPGTMAAIAEQWLKEYSNLPAVFMDDSGTCYPGAARMCDEMRGNGILRRSAAARLVCHDAGDMTSFAHAFTVKHLCRNIGYHDGVRRYLNAVADALRPTTGSPTDELGVLLGRLSRIALLTAWEHKPRQAALLAEDSVICSGASSCIAAHVTSDQVYSPEQVMKWLNEQDTFTGVGSAQPQRSEAEETAIGRARTLHADLAEQFRRPLQLRHATVVPPQDASGDTTVYFFIDNHWEVTRCALFAKSYTRMYKERGQRLRVIVVDPKERRSALRKQLGGCEKDEDQPSEAARPVVPRAPQAQRPGRCGRGQRGGIGVEQ